MSKRWTYEMVVEYVENCGGKVLTKKEDFKNTRVNMEFSCNMCGKKIIRTFKTYRDLNARTCRECTNKKLRELRKLTKEDVLERCNKYGAELITPYNKYENNETIMEFKCECGRHFNRRLADLQKEIDYKCGFCNSHHNYTYQEVKEYIESKGCKLLSKSYQNNRELLKIKCKCGEVFYRKFNSFKDSKQYYCNTCTSNSRAEILIKQLLEDNNIAYLSQYKFKDCRNEKPLPFDFYIPSLNIAIEYDGKQHYKYGCFNMDLLELMNLRRKDKIKTNYCNEYNIKLIRIPYWEFNDIEKILIKELNI